jgi:hypothetical protein
MFLNRKSYLPIKKKIPLVCDITQRGVLSVVTITHTDLEVNWNTTKFTKHGHRKFELGRKVRQTLPTLLFVDPAGGKVKKCAPPAAAAADRQTDLFSLKNNRKTQE